ncbi:hypothetical protein Leryth_005674 [Lithospermum erythrorhizon]|nr:hypothetical protein Leryth_005674 [Lithospermum erythrorhizon]
MDVSCDLEVDVNGEECFMVNKDIISSYSSRIRKLFCKSKGATKTFKVIFHDFPGGAYSFELMTRFCYNGGKIDISLSNTIILYCVATFMEMNQSVSGGENLLQLTEKSTKMIIYWSWSELMIALKQCQDLLPVSSSCGIINKCLNCVIARIVSSSEPSPCPSSSSPDSSGFRLSFESRSTESLKNSSPRGTWWFEDFVVFGTPLIALLVRLMVNRSIDHGVISRFLFYYQKARFVVATTDEKCHIMETVAELLYSLEQSAVPYNKLFGIMRTSLNLRLSSDCKTKLESMIGSRLDQASLDNLLIPSSVGSKSLYNVNLVLRFLKSFVGKEPNILPLSRLKTVARKIDLYLAEVAPDPFLKPANFLYLLKALPDSARDSYDGIYHAIDMYLKVHSGLSEDEKISICCGS